MIIMSRKHYNEIVNNMYDIGYKHGYEAGKREGLFERFTPNEIRQILGLGIPLKEEEIDDE